MKQLVQSLKNEGTILIDSEIPKVSRGKLLIKTISSLVSTGTEKMLVDFGAAGYINKARQQPDKVKQVIEKIKTDGVAATFDAVKSKLDMPIQLGYCNVGEVCEVGNGVKGFEIGDIVVSNGSHSEYVLVSENLCSKVPESVSTDDAVFTVLSSIALQGIRLSNPSIGEIFSVMGLGLVGQLAVQILLANGCKVVAFDFNKERVEFAKKSGADAFLLTDNFDPVSEALLLSDGYGVDGVLITANTTSNKLIKQSANMCRKRGRIILVGVTGLNISRDDFYEKEITFQVSSSYGPGRYERNYEEKGLDYPIGFVRWTEQRNFKSILQLIESKKISPSEFITDRFEIEEASRRYNEIISSSDSLGIIIDFKSDEIQNNETKKIIPEANLESANTKSDNCLTAGLIGSGEYARRILIPNLKKEKFHLKTIASQHGLSGFFSAKKNNIENTTTDFKKIINDPEIETIIISTRHNTHADLIIESLENNKNVFVEKPLCLNHEELSKLKKFFKKSEDKVKKPRLMIGFNRRFAPHIIKIKDYIDNSKHPSSCVITVNAGRLDEDHWLNDPEIGGGRIIGEACHFVDLVYFLFNGHVSEVNTIQVIDKVKDSFSINMMFNNGSIGIINYFCNGNKSFPKEKIELFNEGNIFQIDNFKDFRHFSNLGIKRKKLFFQDKGHRNCIHEFKKSIQNQSDMPISIDDILKVSEITIDASIKCGLS